VFTACVLVGGIVFMRLILPLGLATLDPVPQKEVYLRFRRAFKIVVHSAILLLLISGIYNAWRNWDWYSQAEARPWAHALFGLHILLGVSAFALALVLTAGPQPPRWHRTGMAVGVGLAVLIVAAGAGVKWAREKAMVAPSPEPIPQQIQRLPAG
jgi:cytochrome c oxidase assembly factor CtaG